MILIGPKVVWARFFLGVDPLPSGCGGGGGLIQKVAPMRLKIGQQVAYG